MRLRRQNIRTLQESVRVLLREMCVTAGRNGTGAIEDNTIQLNHRKVHSPWLAACLLMPNGVGLGLIPRPRSGTSNGLGDVDMSWGVSLKNIPLVAISKRNTLQK